VLSRSIFIFSCLCACEFQKEEKEAFRCPECGRLLVLGWRPEYDGARSEAVQFEAADRND
jgi:hypothetical protein